MSGDLGSDSGEQAPGTFGIMLGQVQLLLQLGIDRFANQAQAIELLLRLLGTDGRLVHLGGSKQLHTAILLQEGLEGNIIIGPIPKQPLEVMGKRVEQFDHRLVVIAAGWGKQEAHNGAGQTDHPVQFVAKVLHGLTATDAIVGRADKITSKLGSFVAHTRHRSRVNDRRLFQRQGLQHELQAHADGQNDRPEITLSAIVATAFIESREEGLQTGVMQSEKVILSRFTDQFLIESDGDQFTV